tara:strand:+ start:852 stop:1349 length:498 start_codon:yes stop_codon:yes gene_type:complete
MEKKKRASVALENELELGAVAEAQVAQAEGLLQVVEAIKEHQDGFLRVTIRATIAGVTASTAAICLFLYWQTYNLKQTSRDYHNAIETHLTSQDTGDADYHNAIETHLTSQDTGNGNNIAKIDGWLKQFDSLSHAQKAAVVELFMKTWKQVDSNHLPGTTQNPEG